MLTNSDIFWEGTLTKGRQKMFKNIDKNIYSMKTKTFTKMLKKRYNTSW